MKRPWPATQRRVLLVEPWYGGSHRSWADGLAAHSRHDVTLVTHEARHWRWRMRGSARTLALGIDAVVAQHGPPDLLVATDMVDLPSLLGFARGSLGGVPVALYMHENQLVHVPSRDGRPDDIYATINWLSMAVADRIWCNSAFHRDALEAALPDFVASVPDRGHGAFVPDVLSRMDVLPVGVDVPEIVGRPRRSHFDATGTPLIVWNQRWDHDKDPEALFRVLRALAGNGVDFALALAGELRRRDPQEFDRVRADLGDRVVHAGHLERADYLDLLRRSDVVVSTARHELFGIAPVEAIAAGAVPLLPRRLSYPELIPPEHHDAVLYPSRLYDHLERVLRDLPVARRRVAGLDAAMQRFAWEAVAPRYDDAVDDVVRNRGAAIG